MESERFEALIDAVLAIILTIIVLELPLPGGVTWSAVWEVKIEFFAYLVSFLIVFNYWNSHQEIFSLSNDIDSRVIWIHALLLFILSFLPYLTTYLSGNFYSIMAQSIYALEFVLLDVVFYIIILELKRINPDNEIIQNFNALKEEVLMLGILAIGFIIAFLGYPPAIIFACLISRIIWIFSSYVTRTVG